MDIQKPGVGSSLKPTSSVVSNPGSANILGKPQSELPKCFGTDYFGKWNMMGMTFESMKIDKPEYQSRCAYCKFFERCYYCNHIRLLRIKH